MNKSEKRGNKQTYFKCLIGKRIRDCQLVPLGATEIYKKKEIYDHENHLSVFFFFFFCLIGFRFTFSFFIVIFSFSFAPDNFFN